jgi:hypothetical protein
MSELYSSEERLFFQKIQEFISSADREVLIISPYIKTEVLEKLLNKILIKTSIITTWKLRDIQLGISDLDLFTYCKKKGIFLYLHPRIHLKAFVNDYSQCVFGSANISRKGFALVADHNYELDAKVEVIDIDSVIYFKRILKESVLVNDEIYRKFRDAVGELTPLPELEEPDILSIPKKSEFLISALPMSYDVKELFEIYSNNFKHESNEKRECAIHDIVLYNISTNLDYQKFRKLLKERFFTSNFIEKLLDFITVEDRYFGEVKEWIQKNCEDVPIPSRRDLTGNIQVLYKWVADLSDGEYIVDRPRHSERLYRVK